MQVPYFIRIFYHPVQVLLEQKKESRFSLAFLNSALTGANLGVVGILFLALFRETIGSTPSLSSGVLQLIRHVLGQGLEVFILIPFMTAVLFASAAFLFILLVWICAHLLGGVGTWLENRYLVSILFLPFAIGTFFLNLATVFPDVATIYSAVWGVYVLFLVSCAVAVANKVSLIRGTVALVIPTLALVTMLVFQGSSGLLFGSV